MYFLPDDKKKRKRLVFAYGILVTLLVLGVVWHISSRIARRKTEQLLTQSVEQFVIGLDRDIDIWLETIGDSIVRVMGEAKTLSREEFENLSLLFPQVEISIVSQDGTVLSATDSQCNGMSIYDIPFARDFMVIFTNGGKFISQPFRQSSTDATQICKYGACIFPDGSGMVEVGCSIQNLGQVIKFNLPEWVARQPLGEFGFFVLLGNSLEEKADQASPDENRQILRQNQDALSQKIFACTLPKAGKSHCLSFDYSIYHLVAVIPDREFYSQRNIFFRTTAVYILVFLVPIILLIIRLLDALDEVRKSYRNEKEQQTKDMRVARIIQGSFVLPAEEFMADRMTFRMFATLLPAREVGGDTYGFFPIDDEKVAIFIADVSGKGIPAAIFVTYFRGILWNMLGKIQNLAEAVGKINDHLCQHNEAQMFVTSWLGVMNVAKGTVEYVNAGHNYPYIRRANGTVEILNCRGGLFLGMFPEKKYRAAKCCLEPGDRLFLYTDGVTEAMDAGRRLYGKQRLEKIIEETEGCLLPHVLEDVKGFSGEVQQSDDITILEVAWHGDPKRLSLTLPAVKNSLEGGMSFLQENLAEIDRNCRNRLLITADEILANIVSYSQATQFTINLEIGPDRCRMGFADDGVQYNPLYHDDPKVNIPMEQREPGGLGIMISKKMTNEIKYKYVDGQNILNLLVFRNVPAEDGRPA